ncbi:hypothetical protein ACIQ9K_37690 [Streptomyces microflavus]
MSFVFTHHCRRGIAEMAASLNRLDALVLTGAIGEDQQAEQPPPSCAITT